MLSFERDHESGSNATVGTVSLLPERDVLLVVASRVAVSFGLLLTCHKHSFEIFLRRQKASKNKDNQTDKQKTFSLRETPLRSGMSGEEGTIEIFTTGQPRTHNRLRTDHISDVRAKSDS